MSGAGKLDGERRPGAGLALDPDRASVRLDDSTAEVQPEAEPAIMRRRDRALESVEDARPLGRVDADAVVSHRQPRRARLLADVDLDGLSGAELDGVRDRKSTRLNSSHVK